MWRLAVLYLLVAVLPCTVEVTPAAAQSRSGCAQVYLTGGKGALVRGDLSKAEEFLERAQSCSPEDGNIYVLLGFIYLLRDDASQAVELFQEASEKKPRDFLALPRAVKNALTLADWVAGGQVEARVVRDTFMGFLDFQREKYDPAKTILENATREEPEYGDAHYWLAFSYLRLEVLGKARQEFQDALDSRLRPLLVDTTNLEEFLKDLDEAIRATRRGDQERASALLRRARSRGLESAHAYSHWLGFAAARPAPALAVARMPAQTEPPSAGREAPVPEPPVEGVFVSVLDSRPDYLTLRQEPVWEWRFALAGGNDSNPLGLPDGGVALTPDGNVEGPRSDTVVNLDLRGEYHPFYDREGWSLGVAFEGGQASFADFGFLDLTRLRATVQLAWGGDPLGFLVGPLGYTRVPLDNRRFAVLFQAGATYSVADGESFERLGQLGLGLAVRGSAVTSTQIDLDFADREVFDAGAAAGLPDSEEWNVRISQYVYLGRRDRYVRFAAGSGERTAGAAFDASHLETSIEAALPFAGRWALQLAVSRIEADFDELESNPLFPSFLADRPREEVTLRAVAALVRRWTDHLWLVVRGGYVDREVGLGSASELVDLDFERRVGSIGVTWFF